MEEEEGDQILSRLLLSPLGVSLFIYPLQIVERHSLLMDRHAPEWF